MARTRIMADMGGDDGSFGEVKQSHMETRLRIGIRLIGRPTMVDQHKFLQGKRRKEANELLPGKRAMRIERHEGTAAGGGDIEVPARRQDTAQFPRRLPGAFRVQRIPITPKPDVFDDTQ